jgi:hypothetical protein
VRVSSVVSDLHNDPSAVCVNGIRDDAPAGNLFCRTDSRVAGVAMGIRTDCRAFRNDETRGSALRVIPGVQRGRHAVGSSTHPRKGRHNDSIRKLKSPELNRTEERIIGQCGPLSLLSWREWLEKGNLTHVDCNQQRLFHQLVIAFIRIHSTLGRHNDAVHVAVVRGVVQAGGAAKDVYCVVVPAQ